MSQRLLVTIGKFVKPSDKYFDCIYTENSDYYDLLFEWCEYNPFNGCYLGPWKVTIRGHEIIDQFMEDFSKIKYFIPELQTLKDCWTVHDNEDLAWKNPDMDLEMEMLFEYYDNNFLDQIEGDEW